MTIDKGEWKGFVTGKGGNSGWLASMIRPLGSAQNSPKLCNMSGQHFFIETKGKTTHGLVTPAQLHKCRARRVFSTPLEALVCHDGSFRYVEAEASPLVFSRASIVRPTIAKSKEPK